MASATVESSATAAAAADADDDLQLGFDDLPQVDLRHLSQSELYSLSRLSASSPAPSPSSQDDVVVPIPKIDRSVFNESAGSRKQTYFRLRLAPRTTTSDPPPLPAPISRQRTPEPLEEENSTIISLLKDLFAPHAEPEPPVAATPEEESSSIAVPVSYEESFPKSSDSVLGGIPVSTVDLGFSNRKRGRPRKLQTSSVGLENLTAGKEVPVFEDKNDVKTSENAIQVVAGDWTVWKKN